MKRVAGNGSNTATKNPGIADATGDEVATPPQNRRVVAANDIAEPAANYRAVGQDAVALPAADEAVVPTDVVAQWGERTRNCKATTPTDDGITGTYIDGIGLPAADEAARVTAIDGVAEHIALRWVVAQAG